MICRWKLALPLGTVALPVALLLVTPRSAHAAQPLETETARFLAPHALELETTYEHQFSSEGTELALPLAVEYGIREDLEILVEPVFATSIRPKTGDPTNGVGDLEVTMTYRVLGEQGSRPAVALAGEVKVPTAKNTLIGTGETDYTAYLIASRLVGRVDLHGNLGYTFIGQPPGPHLDNIVDYAAAAEYHLSPRGDIVAEFIGNTTSTPEGEGSDAANSVIPEAAGGEMVGMLGGRWHANPRTAFALGVSVDNNSAVLLRPGVTFRW